MADSETEIKKRQNLIDECELLKVRFNKNVLEIGSIREYIKFLSESHSIDFESESHVSNSKKFLHGEMEVMRFIELRRIWKDYNDNIKKHCSHVKENISILSRLAEL